MVTDQQNAMNREVDRYEGANGKLWANVRVGGVDTHDELQKI